MRRSADNAGVACDAAMTSAEPLAKRSRPVIRGRSMKNALHSLARLGLLALLVMVPATFASAQTNIAKAIQEKLAAEAAKLENSCADDIKKFCSDVTPGEGRMLYCMHAHEDKISAKCAYDLEEAATDVQLHADLLKEAIGACKAEISGVCGKIQPGQGRIAACLFENKSTASKACGEVLGKLEAIAAH
jgi:Cysteine rich repeat